MQGRAIPLLVPDIDTDVITPIKRVMQGGDALTRYAFESLRYTPDGALNPDCPLNQEVYRDAPILLAGANFACGSSRETAVWAVRGLGIRCIIAPSFGDIFFDSCFENGLLPITLPQAEVDALADEAADRGVPRRPRALRDHELERAHDPVHRAPIAARGPAQRPRLDRAHPGARPGDRRVPAARPRAPPVGVRACR